MNLNKLYNYDEERDVVYEQREFTIPEGTRRVFLDHIPREGTLTVVNVTTQKPVTIVNNKEPSYGEVFFEYRSEYDYVAAKGLLIFNEYDAKQGYKYYARYKPVASRVDAEPINELIEFGNTYDGNVWTKEDLVGPKEEDIVAWTAVKDRPTLVTHDQDGLMSKEDKEKLDEIVEPHSKKAIGGLKLDEDLITPAKWGDPLNFAFGEGIAHTSERDESGVITKTTFTVNVPGMRNQLDLSVDKTDAARGATWIGMTDDDKPSDSNRFVTDKDPRLSDDRPPKPHTHSADDIKVTATETLPEVLNNKAEREHTHYAVDIVDGMEYFKGDDGISPEVYVDSVEQLAPLTMPTVENVGTVYNVRLKFGIPRGQDGSVRWEDLSPEQQKSLQIKGDKGDPGMPAYVRARSTTTGPAFSIAQVTNNYSEEEIGGVIRQVNDMDFTIPRGDPGERGYSGAIVVGTVTTTDNNKDAVVTTGETKDVVIGDKTYSATTVNFELPRGPRGLAHASKIDFTEDDSRWSEYDEDKELTILTIDAIGGVPITKAYEEVEPGVFEMGMNTVRFDYDHVYIYSDHKFGGCIYVDGLDE